MQGTCGRERGGGSPGDRACQGIPQPTVGLRGSWGSTGPLLLRRTARHRGDVGQILPRVAWATSRSTAGGVLAPASPRLPRWDFGFKLGCSRGSRDGTGTLQLPGASCRAGPRGSGDGHRAAVGAGSAAPRGSATQPVPVGPGPPSPMQRAGITPGGSHPHLHRGFLLGGGGLPQKSLSQRATAAEDWVPHLPSVPATFGCPPRSPPLPAQPYPFQVELSWGGGSRGAGTGGEGAGGGERGERSKNGGRGEEEEQGIKLATKKPRGLKTAEFHTRSALERYRTRFGSDARGGSGGSS